MAAQLFGCAVSIAAKSNSPRAPQFGLCAASAGGGVHHHPRQGVAVEQRHRHRRAVEMGGGHRAPGVQGLAQFGGVVGVVAQHFAEALRQFRVGGMKFKTDRHSVSANR